jgi:hypothetical protein
MRYLHIPGVTATAEFSSENGILYRYWLEVAKPSASKEFRTACVVMQNPSYASDEQADKSVQFMEKNVFERGLPEFTGVGRLIVVNQFARVQTKGFVGLASDVGAKNNMAIRRAIKESEIVILGWGKTNRFEEQKQFVLGLLRGTSEKNLYETRMHPSRGRYEDFILPADA